MTDPKSTPDAPAPDLRARLLAILEEPMIADWKADRILEIAVPRGGPGPGWHVKELRKFAAGWTGEIPGPGSLAGLAADQIEMLDRRIDELAALRADPAAAPREPAGGWRPIDDKTPRDRPIQVIQMTPGDWEGQQEVVRYREPLGFMGHGGLWPTHWKPLDPPPAAGSSEG